MCKLDVWKPELYSKCSDLQYNAALKFLDMFSFTKDEDILDIGCGDGKITAYLALNTLGNVLGIDKSQAMIAFANKTHVMQNLRFALMDIEKLKLEKKFKVITSFFCLPWVQNKTLAFVNIASLLKENGRLLTTFALFNKSQINLIHKLIKEPRWETYFKNYSSPFLYLNDINYEYYASLAGVKLYSTITKSITQIFQTKLELKNFLVALVPHLNQIPELTEKNDFVEDMLISYLKEITNTNYSLTIDTVSFVGKLSSDAKK